MRFFAETAWRVTVFAARAFPVTRHEKQRPAAIDRNIRDIMCLLIALMETNWKAMFLSCFGSKNKPESAERPAKSKRQGEICVRSADDADVLEGSDAAVALSAFSGCVGRGWGAKRQLTDSLMINEILRRIVRISDAPANMGAASAGRPGDERRELLFFLLYFDSVNQKVCIY